MEFINGIGGHTFWVFWAASLALYVSPGPDMIYVVSRALGQGRRAGVVSGLGVSSGIFIHMMAAAFGLAALLQVWPAAFEVIRWTGVAYLAYLGVRAFRADDAAFRPAGGTGRADLLRLYRQGVLCNLLNPKIALFFLAFLPQFTVPAEGSMTIQLLFWGGMFLTGGLAFVVALGWLCGGAGDWLAGKPGITRWQRRITGSSMLGLALFLALEDGAGR